MYFLRVPTKLLNTRHDTRKRLVRFPPTIITYIMLYISISLQFQVIGNGKLPIATTITRLRFIPEVRLRRLRPINIHDSLARSGHCAGLQGRYNNLRNERLATIPVLASHK